MKTAIKKVFVNDGIYHLFNRGVAKQKIFADLNDYQHLLTTFSFYLESFPKTKLADASRKFLKEMQSQEPQKPLVEILAYCLMSNHFHLLVKQLVENGISTFIRRSLNSYSRYYNTKHDRVGPLFQGTFKSVPVENDEQFMHVSRYIHLNPFMEKLVGSPDEYIWSSYKNYRNNKSDRLCKTSQLIDYFGSPKEYKEFMEDYAEYVSSLNHLDQIILE